MSPRPGVDLVRWFGEDEREECSTCGEPARVAVSTRASFCLACGAAWVADDPVEAEPPRTEAA